MQINGFDKNIKLKLPTSELTEGLCLQAYLPQFKSLNYFFLHLESDCCNKKKRFTILSFDFHQYFKPVTFSLFCSTVRQNAHADLFHMMKINGDGCSQASLWERANICLPTTQRVCKGGCELLSILLSLVSSANEGALLLYRCSLPTTSSSASLFLSLQFGKRKRVVMATPHCRALGDCGIDRKAELPLLAAV